MNDIFWVEESSENPLISKKRKRRVGKRTIEFIGWGSRPLIDFLEAIGQDTTKKHSQRDVAAFITKYINEKGLASAEKKKKVLCDERLQALFGKKSVSRIKVYELLEEHFAENHDDSDDELLDSSEEEDYGEKSCLSSKTNPTSETKKVPKTPKSCFAALVPENIKLIYLKKSLIQELLKVPESFDSKIVGSFVRMKSDPNDIYQKNRFQLQQVTGVEKIPGGGDAGPEIFLRVSNFVKDVPISMLSDDDFTEEEIEDVQERIRAGLLKRLNVNELELKAQILHADITKHWIAKEISLLHKLIEHANEKGWRRQMFEYIERRKMLQTPSEQEKLLLKIPEVIAEELEPESAVATASEKAEGSGCSPKSILRGSSDVSSTDASGCGDISAPSQGFLGDGDTNAPGVLDAGVGDIMLVTNANGSGDILAPSQVILGDTHAPGVLNAGVGDIMLVTNANGHEGSYEISKQVDEMGDHRVTKSGEKETKEKPELVEAIITNGVIELSDDESEDEASECKNPGIRECPDEVIWNYVDPKGQTRGPFSLRSLKRWSDASYFHPGFRVWKSTGTSDDGLLLVDVLRRAFPP